MLPSTSSGGQAGPVAGGGLGRVYTSPLPGSPVQLSAQLAPGDQ